MSKVLVDKLIHTSLLLSIFCAVGLLTIWLDVVAPFQNIDYGAWKSDFEVFRSCLLNSEFDSCHALSKFSIAYLLNSGAAHGDGLNLMIFNVCFLAVPILVISILKPLDEALWATVIYIIVIAISPVPVYYVNSGALEVQAGVLGGIFLSGATRTYAPGQKLWELMYTLFWTASGVAVVLYKDTNALVLLLSIFASGYIVKLNSGSQRIGNSRVSMVTIFALIFGLVLNIAYNLLRYGSLFPEAYIHEAKLTSPDLIKSAEFFFGIIFSPNGGFLVFWGCALVSLYLLATIGIIIPNKRTIFSGAMFVLLSAIGYANWWAPFGWDAWGNRLMVAPVLAVIVAVVINSDYETPATQKFTRWKWIVGLVLIIPSIYYVAIPYISPSPEEVLRSSLATEPYCVKMYRHLVDGSINSNESFWRGDAYYQCARERMFYIPSLH